MIAYSEKVKRHYLTKKDHSLMEIEGSNGETYEVWFFDTGKFIVLALSLVDWIHSRDKVVGCKHLLAHAIHLTNTMDATISMIKPRSQIESINIIYKQHT